MKKFISVLVSVMLCVCLLAPAVSAANADIDSLVAKLEGFDISALSTEDISTILGVDDMGTINSVIGSITGGETPDIAAAAEGLDIEGVLGDLESIDADSVLESLSGLLGDVDLSGLTGSVSDGDALSSILGMFEGVDMSSFDVSALTDMISGAFGEGGLDLGALTEGMDLGSFDISSVLGGLGGGDAAGGSMDVMSTIMDALTSGLGSLGLDTSMLAGLADTDIVNFFANMFMGLGGDDAGSSSGSNTVVVTPTTAAPSVTGTKTPNTGDTSAVFAALATITVASAAAFVCLGSKKRNED